jgi:hypothetical protein
VGEEEKKEKNNNQLLMLQRKNRSREVVEIDGREEQG